MNKPTTRGHVRQRGNKHTASVPLPKGADGERRTKWLGSFATKKQAQQAVTKALRELDTQAHSDARGTTFAAYAERYLREQAVLSAWSVTTAYDYQTVLRLYLLPHLGPLTLDAITPARLERLILDLSTQDGRRVKGGVSAQTLRNAWMLLSAIMNAAVRQRLLARSPLVEVPAPKAPRPRGVAHSVETLARVLAAAKGDGDWYPLLLTALGTGLRLGEFLALTWEDVDLPRGVLSVSRAVTQIPGAVVTKGPKSDKGRRTVPLPPLVRTALQELRERRPDAPAVFLHHGKPYTLGQFWHAWSDFRRRHELPAVTMHSLRHTYASSLLSAGVSAYLVSHLMGHASITTTTLIYGHLLGGEAEGAAAALEGALQKVAGGGG